MGIFVSLFAKYGYFKVVIAHRLGFMNTDPLWSISPKYQYLYLTEYSPERKVRHFNHLTSEGPSWQFSFSKDPTLE